VIKIIRLIEYDRGGVIAAPGPGFAMFHVDDVKDRGERQGNRFTWVGCRDFVEPIPEEPGIALYRVQEGDLLGEAYLRHFIKDDPQDEGYGRQVAPWERPWWPRIAADPRPVFIVHPPWEVYVDGYTRKARTPPPMPTEGVEVVDHYQALRRDPKLVEFFNGRRRT
jgi:hypothetical protein